MNSKTTHTTAQQARPALYVVLMDDEGKDVIYISDKPADVADRDEIFVTVPGLQPRYALRVVINVLRNGGANVIEE